MLEIIEINNIEWTLIPADESFYRNNCNIKIYLQEMNDEEEPEDDDGMVILPFESFKINNSDKYYYLKSSIDKSYITIDLNLITPITTQDGGGGDTPPILWVNNIKL